MQNSKLAVLFISVFSCAVSLQQAHCGEDTNSNRAPNIVFIIADDLGWADVAFHGGNAPTPNLDRLAKEGLELTQHYVAPVCSPTRTGLMTGRCWSRFNVTSPQNDRALPWDTVTLPKALQSAGYKTCLAGKWHLGSLPEQGPNHFGFDHSYGSLAGGVSPWNHRYKQGPFTQTWHRNEKLISEEGHVTDLIAAEAIDWLSKRSGEKPFFLYVPFTAVHLPIKEPAEWLQKVPEKITGDVPRHYAACIMHLDDAVGQIIAAAKKTKHGENTLVVFTSDNGGSWAQNNDLKYPDDNCPNGKLPGNNHPWRGQKGELYEGGVRVPTIVHWPAGTIKGQMATPVQIIDWMPTFCEVAGYKPASNLNWDGVSLTKVLRGVPLPERPLYSVAPGYRARSMRLGNYKLIVTGKDANQKIELFDLSADPGEATNLAEKQPDKLKELLTKMDEAAKRDKDSIATK